MREVVIIDKPSAGPLQSGDEFPLWRGDKLTGKQYRTTLSNLIQALKSDFYTETEIDELFSINDVGADNFTAYDPLYSYIGGVTYYVKYLGTIWKFISDTTQTGVDPDSDPLIWDPVNVGEFAHEVNKDSKLAEDTDDEVTAAELRLFLDSAGLAGGYVPLNGSGKLDDQYMPDLSIVQYLGEVADETAMLALDGQYGDWCIRQDNDKVYVITGPDPTLSGDWRALSYPGAGISGTGLANRVTYWTGTGALSYSAVTLTELEYLSGVTSGIQAQLNGKANLTGATFTGSVAATDFRVGATTVISSGRVLQNVSGNISMFTNDIGYLTSADLSGYATQSWVNSQGYLKSADLSGYLTVSDLGSLNTDIYNSQNIIATGWGSGSVAMTTNDGKGNANLTFNHVNGDPDTNGSAARIEVSVDSTTANMYFELGDNVTSGVDVNLGLVLQMNTSQVTTHKPLRVNNAYTLPSSDGSANYVLTTNGSGTVSWAPAGSGSVGNLQNVTNNGNETSTGIKSTSRSAVDDYNFSMDVSAGSYGVIRALNGTSSNIHFFGDSWNTGHENSRGQVNIQGDSSSGYGVTFGLWNDINARIYKGPNSQFFIIGDEYNSTVWDTAGRAIIRVGGSQDGLIGFNAGGVSSGYILGNGSGVYMRTSTAGAIIRIGTEAGGDHLRVTPDEVEIHNKGLHMVANNATIPRSDGVVSMYFAQTNYYYGHSGSSVIRWGESGNDNRFRGSLIVGGDFAPAETLDVNGNIRSRSAYYSDSGVYYMGGTAGSIRYKASWNAIGANNGVGTFNRFVVESTSSFAMRVTDSTGSIVGINVDTNGTPSLAVGKSSASYELDVVGNIYGSGYLRANSGNFYGSSASTRLNIQTNGAFHSSRLSVNQTTVNTSYTFYVNGTGYATSNFIAGSDERIKTPVDFLEDALDKIMMLRPYRYIKYGELELGFGAQTTYRILPEVVSRPKQSDELWGIKYDQFTALNTKAIQMIRTEQLSDRERIKALEAKVREQDEIIQELKRLAA